MITTLYVIQLVAFYLWQVTAPKRQPASGVWTYAVDHKSQARLVGVALLLVAGVGFVAAWGLAGGIAGFFVELMAVGCLSVVVEPLGYLRAPGVAVLYVCCVLLELIL